MERVDREVDRVLLLLRNKIRERGFTQLQVQERLSWGRSYVSQILTKQKALRLEQVLLILDVIGIDPAEFFEELYPRGGNPRNELRYSPGAPVAPYRSPQELSPDLSRTVTELRSMVRGLVGVLVDHDVIGVDDLTVAVHAADLGSVSI